MNNTAPAISESIFDGFGSNWRWATVDARGSARVHTFMPTFSEAGFIKVPSAAEGNSQRVEGYDFHNLTVALPVVHVRQYPQGCPTDRFGVPLPRGADPVEAADVAPPIGIPPCVMQAGAVPVLQPGVPAFNNGDAVNAQVFGQDYTATVVAMDGPLYLVRFENGNGYAGVEAGRLTKRISEFEAFCEEACKHIDADPRNPKFLSDFKALFDAGCRFQ